MTLHQALYRKEEIPAFGFSPDSRFPVIYAERGLLQFRLEADRESGILIHGGSAFNAVPDSIVYNGERQADLADKLDRLGFEYQWTEDGIEVRGRAAHAMIPEEGVNAIARLCIALNAIGIQSRAINFVVQETGQDPNATRIFGECEDEPSGRLKFNVGKIELGGTEQLFMDWMPGSWSPHPPRSMGWNTGNSTGLIQSICPSTILWSRP